MPRPLLVAAACFCLGPLTASAPAAAHAASHWRLDPHFGHGGRVVLRAGGGWTAPQGAFAGPDGRVLVTTDSGRVRALTPAGRPDLRWGTSGAANSGSWGLPLFGAQWGNRTLVSAFSDVPEDLSPGQLAPPLLLDRRGRRSALSSGLRAALRGDRTATQQWVLPMPGGDLLHLQRWKARWVARRVTPRLRVRSARQVFWPEAHDPNQGLDAWPVWSGLGAILALQDGRGGQLFRWVPGRGLDPAWGTRGAARIERRATRLLPWDAGVVAVSDDRLTWLDRHGRVVRIRAVKADVAAIDREGRVVVGRARDHSGWIGLVRFGADSRPDRAFGEHRFELDSLVEPRAVLTGPGARITVLGALVRANPDAGDWDEPDVLPAGTAVWRLRP